LDSHIEGKSPTDTDEPIAEIPARHRWISGLGWVNDHSPRQPFSWLWRLYRSFCYRSSDEAHNRARRWL